MIMPGRIAVRRSLGLALSEFRPVVQGLRYSRPSRRGWPFSAVLCAGVPIVGSAIVCKHILIVEDGRPDLKVVREASRKPVR